AKAKGLRYLADVPAEGTLAIRTDVGKLRQIVYNLLANAVKFTDHGTVTLAAQRDADCLVLEVRDTGPGIAPDQLSRVFDAFWQGEHSGAPRPGGTGLGLSISHRLAQLLGGELTAESTLGQGTTFRVTIPLEPSTTRGAPQLA